MSADIDDLLIDLKKVCSIAEYALECINPLSRNEYDRVSKELEEINEILIKYDIYK
jgi:hypothetical protein